MSSQELTLAVPPAVPARQNAPQFNRLYYDILGGLVDGLSIMTYDYGASLLRLLIILNSSLVRLLPFG